MLCKWASLVDMFSPEHEVSERKYRAAQSRADKLGDQLRGMSRYDSNRDAVQKQYGAAYAESRRLHDDWVEKTNRHYAEQERQRTRWKKEDARVHAEDRKAFNRMYEAGVKAGKAVDMRIPLVAGGLAVAGLGAYGVHRAMRNK